MLTRPNIVCRDIPLVVEGNVLGPNPIAPIDILDFLMRVLLFIKPQRISCLVPPPVTKDNTYHEPPEPLALASA